MTNLDSAAIEQCDKLLSDKKLTIAFVESATAGSLSAAFARLPHAGSFLKGGIVCYDACVKEDVLGISKELIEQYTPESTEVTRALALKLKEIIPADVIVAVTGLTTPGGSETEQKPVGTMFFCILIDGKATDSKVTFTGPQDVIVSKTIEQISLSIIKALA
jgi:nicotinamide-nucleotide amidase